MAWRVAKSLDVLLAEINEVAPNRSKASDGTIGDDAHRGTDSDHNENDAGVVCAEDFTHDPGDGADMNVIAEHLRKRNHPAVKYVIWNRRIWSKARNSEGWRRYNGSNPHDKHMHVSVGVGSDGHSTGPYDDTSSWGISTTGNDEMGGDMIGLKQGDKGEQVKALQGLLTRSGFSPGVHDGDYGSKTAAAVLAMRKSQGSSATDGINFTGAAYEQLFVALIKNQAKGIKGDAGQDGKDGRDGKDGVLKLPAAVTINGTVTALKQ